MTADAAAARLLHAFGSVARIFAAEPTALMSVLTEPDTVERLLSVRSLMLDLLRPVSVGERNPPSGSSLVRYLWILLAHAETEMVRAVYLDQRGLRLHDEEVARGCGRHAMLDPRLIVRRSLELGARRLIVAHNHPSGDPTPSRADRRATDLLVAAAKLFNIAVQDHLVFASGGWSSMRALGWLEA